MLSRQIAYGVATTGDVIYTYGAGTQVKSVGVCREFYESYSYGQLNQITSVDRFIQGRRYTSAYSYNPIGQRTQSTAPGLTLPFGYDNSGRLSSVGTNGQYMSGFTYNSGGQLTADTLGNGVTETFGYDNQRMQLTTETVTAPGGATGGLMSLTYGDQAAAGQNGAGSSAGDSGQLMSISGTINGITESATYTYDLLGRLATSNQNSNGASAQRRFAYDRWGNRTGEWDATSAGNQIQTVTLRQSGGVPTNQIASVNAVNYTYDAAGNLTNDGAHSYQYDGENRLVSVDAGATAKYSYDHRNRRIVKLIAGSQTDCLWDGNQLIEEHDGNASIPGATLARYVYAGSRMVAKIVGGVTSYYISDRLSARLILDASGNVIGRQAHLPFGEDFGESGSQEKHHFTSYERDTEVGTDYAVNRQYSQPVSWVTHQKVIVNTPSILILLLRIYRQTTALLMHRCLAATLPERPRISRLIRDQIGINRLHPISTDSIQGRCSSSDKGCKSRRRLRARDFSLCLCRVPRTRTSHASGSRLSRVDPAIFSLPLASGPQKNNRFQAVSI